MLWFNFFPCCGSRDKDAQDTLPKKEMTDSFNYLDLYRKNNIPEVYSISEIENQSKINQSSTTDPIVLQEQHFKDDFNTDQFFDLDKKLENSHKSDEQQKIEFEQPLEEVQQQDRLDQNISVFNESSAYSRQPQGVLSMQVRGQKNHPQPERKKRNVRLWSEKEDEELKRFYKEFQGNWEKIAASLPGRNISQCSQRWRRMNPTIGKQKWTNKEDMQIIALVQKFGRNWGLIAREHNSRSDTSHTHSDMRRSGKQIRERYLNKLDPNLISQKWSPEEDDHIYEMFQKFGSRWSKIATELKGRSENQVKNRFYTYIKRVKLGEKNKYQIVYNQKDQFNQVKQQDETKNDDDSFGSSADSSSSQFPMDKLPTILNENMIQEEQ